MRGQAALQGIYNPDRIKTPLLKEAGKWRPVTYAEAEAILQAKAEAAVRNGKGRVRMLTEVVGESLLNLASESLKNWDSQGPVIFEPFGYEALKEANSQVFGLDGLPSYKINEADFLVSFGADFLETWLSPVEYARKFKDMHALRGQNKSLFFHVSPHWRQCRFLVLLQSRLRTFYCSWTFAGRHTSWQWQISAGEGSNGH
jgi:molybdopterin-containing oxidoreductase family iron-sulfur binding subunit